MEDLTKVWTKSATMLLLSEYEFRRESFENSDVKKKVLWQEISDALATNGVVATAAQAENKWKVLLKCYKTAIGMIRLPPGKVYNSRQFPYMQKMGEILRSKVEENAEGEILYGYIQCRHYK